MTKGILKRGDWIGENDGFGIVGWSFTCEKCQHLNRFVSTTKWDTKECSKCKKEHIISFDPEDYI